MTPDTFMNASHNLFGSLQKFDLGNGQQGAFYSLPALEKAGVGPISRLPVSIRLVLESVLRNCDGKKVSEAKRPRAGQLEPEGRRTEEIPFVVARIVLQDFTGVPLLVDLAAMRSAVARLGKNPKIIEPLVPVDLVVDHSVQVDFAGTADALQKNLEMEFQRNRERYQFLKWGMQAFDTFKVVPPGIGIVHQVNLEYLAKGVLCDSERRLLSRHAGRHRFAHHDDQRPRHCRLGRRRHRGRSRHARTAGLFSDAGRGGRAPDRRAARRCHRHRPGADGHADAAQGESGRQIRRVLRPGRGGVARGGPRDHREHGARIRRDDGLLPDRWRMRELPPRAPAAAKSIAKLYENYYRAQGLFGMPKRGEIDYSADLELDLAQCRAECRRSEASAGSHRTAEIKDEFVSAFSTSRGGKWFRERPQTI